MRLVGFGFGVWASGAGFALRKEVPGNEKSPPTQKGERAQIAAGHRPDTVRGAWGFIEVSRDGSFSGRGETLRDLLLLLGAFPDGSLILGFFPAGRTAQLFAKQFIHEPGHRHTPFPGFVVEAGDEESINRGRVVPK